MAFTVLPITFSYSFDTWEHRGAVERAGALKPDGLDLQSQCGRLLALSSWNSHFVLRRRFSAADNWDPKPSQLPGTGSLWSTHWKKSRGRVAVRVLSVQWLSCHPSAMVLAGPSSVCERLPLTGNEMDGAVPDLTPANPRIAVPVICTVK